MDATSAVAESFSICPSGLNEFQKWLVGIAIEIGEEIPLTPEQIKNLQDKRASVKGGMLCGLVDQSKEGIPTRKETLPRQRTCSLYPRFEYRPILDQVTSLRKRLPSLSSPSTKIPLFQGDGVFAIPNPEKIASSYVGAVQVLFGIMKKDRGGHFLNLKYSKIDDNHIRQDQRTRECFQKIIDQQDGADILFVPCQLGRAYTNNLLACAQKKMKDVDNEFALNIYMAAAILITHPKRLLHDGDMGIDLVGDEFLPSIGETKEIPAFSFKKDEKILVFSSRKDCASTFFGIPTGYIF